MRTLRVVLLNVLLSSLAQSAFGGMLAGALTELSHQDAVNLSEIGTLDWAVFGLGGSGTNNGSLVPDSRMSAGAAAVGLIGDLSKLQGNEQLTDGGQYTFAPLFGWTGGTPIASNSAVGEDDDAALMVRQNANGAGLSWSLPADTTPRSALVYVGAFQATGSLSATLSDGSSAAFTPVGFTHDNGIDRVGVYRIDYAADSLGQSLDLTWEQTEKFTNFNMISLSAVALTTPDTLPPIDDPPPTEVDYFAPAVTIGGHSTGGAISTAAADLTGDGLPEIITTATSNSSVPHFRIYQRDQFGAWSGTDVLSQSEVNSRPNRFGGDSIVIDMNGDNYPDILLPETENAGSPGQVAWYENPKTADLSGGWTEHVIATWPGTGGAESPAHMSEIYAGDMDGDGDTDVVTRDIANGVYVLENNGQNQFTRHFVATNPREGLDLFDPDQDGDLDILLNGVWLEAPDAGAGSFADLSNTSGYQFHPITPDGLQDSPWYPDATNTATIRDYACKVLAADLNGDGLEDVVITNSEELGTGSAEVKPEGLTVFLADSVGGTDWTEIVVQDFSSHLHNLDAADVDLDGDLDLLTGVSTVGAGSEPAEVFVFLNDGDGLSWTRSSVEALNMYSGVFADVDGDGDPDIVGPNNWNSGPLRLFESLATESVLPGDYNNDGVVDAADYTVWRDNLGAPEGSLPNDIDRGVIGAAQYATWTANFGAVQAGGVSEATATPEPSAALTTLLMLSLAGGRRANVLRRVSI